MNVLKPNLKITIGTLLEKGLSQREISRKTGIHRRTIRRYCQEFQGVVFEGGDDSKCATLATGSFAQAALSTPIFEAEVDIRFSLVTLDPSRITSRS